MYAKPIHCTNCKHWHEIPRTDHRSWCGVHKKPAVRALALCIKEKSKELITFETDSLDHLFFQQRN